MFLLRLTRALWDIEVVVVKRIVLTILSVMLSVGLTFVDPVSYGVLHFIHTVDFSYATSTTSTTMRYYT